MEFLGYIITPEYIKINLKNKYYYIKIKPGNK